MSHARETTLTFFSVMDLSPLKPKSFALYNFDTLRHILIMFCRNPVSMSNAKRQLSLSSLCSYLA